MESILSSFAMWFIAIIILVLWSLLLAWPFQLLWNWIIPAIFGFGKITFFQAFGLKLLFALVFGRMTIEDKRKKVLHIWLK